MEIVVKSASSDFLSLPIAATPNHCSAQGIQPQRKVACLLIT